jgi:hypothetical protein
MPKKVPVFQTEEFKQAAKERMEKYWEKKRKQEGALVPIKGILERVYMAGWKQNKSQFITFSNQMSVSQAEAELTKLFNEAFNA